MQVETNDEKETDASATRALRQEYPGGSGVKARVITCSGYRVWLGTGARAGFSCSTLRSSHKLIRNQFTI
jgi:hypothetical protein